MVSRIWLFYSLSQRTIFNLKPDPVSLLVEFSRRSFSRRQSSLHEDLSTPKSRPVQRFVVTKWYQRIPSGSRNLRTGGSSCRSPTWWIYHYNLLWSFVSEPKTIKFIEKVFPWLQFANIKLANRFSSSISVIQAYPSSWYYISRYQASSTPDWPGRLRATVHYSGQTAHGKNFELLFSIEPNCICLSVGGGIDETRIPCRLNFDYNQIVAYYLYMVADASKVAHAVPRTCIITMRTIAAMVC